METIGKIALGANSQRRNNSGAISSNRLPDSWVEALFAKFAARYLNKWTSSFPTPESLRVAVSEWAERLGGLSGEEIKYGLDNWKGRWPPSVEEFREACRPDVGLTENADMYRIQQKSLPEPDWRKAERNAKGIEAITELRGKLNKTAGDRDD